MIAVAPKPQQTLAASLISFSIATVGEFLALTGWFALHHTRTIAAVLVLWAGFIVERWVVVKWLDIPKLVVTPAGNLRSRTLVLFGVTLAEIVIWVIWIWLVEQQEPWFAAAFLFFGIHAVHAYEVALIKHAQVMRTFVNQEVFLITFLEAAGAVWALTFVDRGLIAPALAIMFTALLLEHWFQVLGLRRDAESGV